MKDGDAKGQPVHIAVQEPPFDTAPLELASDVVEETNREGEREVLKEGLDKNHDVMLFLSHGTHICNKKNDVVTAEEGHESGVIEKL
ncbi:hypothetical protein H0H92_002437, partial [Tricholoma furcatifolium]